MASTSESGKESVGICSLKEVLGLQNNSGIEKNQTRVEFQRDEDEAVEWNDDGEEERGKDGIRAGGEDMDETINQCERLHVNHEKCVESIPWPGYKFYGR